MTIILIILTKLIGNKWSVFIFVFKIKNKSRLAHVCYFKKRFGIDTKKIIIILTSLNVTILL